MTDEQVIARLRKEAQAEREREKRALAELEVKGLTGPFDVNDRKQWIAEVVEVLERHGVDWR